MSRPPVLRLSVVMFLQFFIVGAFIPILSLYLIHYLHFTGKQTGLIFSLTAAGAMIAPLFTVYIADRYIKAERLFALCHLAGGAILFAFSAQTEFIPAALLYLAYTLLNTPTFALTNAIIFHHSPGKRHRFGSIRVWGTIGWIAVAWVFSFFWLREGGAEITADRLPDAFTLAGIASILLGLFAFTLPDRGPLAAGPAALLPHGVLTVFGDRKVIVFCLFMFLMTLIDRFYYFGTSPFLHAAGFADRSIMPLMSLGQIPEVFGMFVLGWLLHRAGSKKIMLLGIGCDLFRYATCVAGAPAPLIIAGLVVHGLAYTFVYTTAAIYLDGFCDTASRTGAHQLYGFITSGVGNFSGSLLVGATLDWCTHPDGTIDYQTFWLIPVVGTAALFTALLLLRPASPRAGQKDAPTSEHEVHL